MPTSKAAVAALLCFALSACVGGLGGGGGDVAREIAVTSDQIVIAGPRGFCVDPGATRNGDESAFVLFGSCAVIAQSRSAGQPGIPAVLTAAVSAPGNGGEIASNLDQLEGFFTSVDGRRLLSRMGDADRVEILESFIEDGVFFLHARDTSPGGIDGVQSDYWRAYLDIGTRVATLTLLGREGEGLTRDEALRRLSRFVALTQGANPVAAEAVAETAATPPATP